MKKELVEQLKKHKFSSTTITVEVGQMDKPTITLGLLYMEAGTRRYKEDIPIFDQIVEEIESDLLTCEKAGWTRYLYYIYEVAPANWGVNVLRYAKAGV